MVNQRSSTFFFWFESTSFIDAEGFERIRERNDLHMGIRMAESRLSYKSDCFFCLFKIFLAK